MPLPDSRSESYSTGISQSLKQSPIPTCQQPRPNYVTTSTASLCYGCRLAVAVLFVAGVFLFLTLLLAIATAPRVGIELDTPSYFWLQGGSLEKAMVGFRLSPRLAKATVTPASKHRQFSCDTAIALGSVLS